MGTACEGCQNIIGAFLYGWSVLVSLASRSTVKCQGGNSQDSFPISSFAKYYPHVAGRRSDQHRDYST